jgi:hypothetical protein
MTSYSTTTTIAASPERVWALLVDGPSYTTWNPTVVELDGTIAEGEKIKLVSTVSPKRTFTLRVEEVRPQSQMVWSSGMPLGLFKGTRTFTLDPAGDGTRFTMEEVYTGLLAGIITRSIPDMTASFAQFAAGLKTASEG